MSVGYDKLKAAVDKDCKKDGGTIHLEGCVTCGGKCFHKYCNKFKWVIDRAKAYGEATGLNWEDVLDSWETDRNYWYMNYYQDCNQPEIKAGKVRVFGTIFELKEAIGEMKFRCPSCGKESSNPYECKACGWKVYGLLGDMGKGVFVYVKEQLRGETMFMPVSWEQDKVLQPGEKEVKDYVEVNENKCSEVHNCMCTKEINRKTYCRGCGSAR